MNNVIKSAERMTRRSYKRKIITMGVSIFSALALFATGFASWVLSSGAEDQKEGNISVGVVSDNSVTFGEVTLSANSFSFNPAKEDTSGRVQWDGENHEVLSVKISVPITGYDNIKTLTVALAVPDAVAKTAGYSITDYDPAGTLYTYINLPTCSTTSYKYELVESTGEYTLAKKTNSPVVILDQNFTSADDAICYAPGEDYLDTWTVTEQADGTHLLEYTVNFKWGNYFGGQNPSIYYDDGAGSSESIISVGKQIDAFRAMMAGKSTAEYEALTDEEKAALDFGDFKITITATAKD